MRFAAGVDWVLELTVVGSFTRTGIVLRRSLFGWEHAAPDALAGRTVLVTGPTSGLGRAATMALAALGARVILAGRSEQRLAEVRDALVAEYGEDRFPLLVVDTGSLASVGDAVAHVLATEPQLDVLVDNAGAIFLERTEGPDGIESTLATLVVGPFALIAGLLPLLRRTEGSRVICVTSGGMYTQAVPLDDLQYRSGAFSGPRAYARAKRIQVALVREWARRLDGAVTINTMHPGWADTPGLAESLPRFYARMQRLLRTPAEGVDTIVWLASAPGAGAGGGRVYLDRRPRPFDRVRRTRLSGADRRRLWDEIVALAGIADPAPD